MDYIIHKKRKHWFLLFFAFFGLILLLLYKFGSNDVVIKNDNIEKKSTVEDVLEVDGEVYSHLIKNSFIVVPDTTYKVSLVDGRASFGTESLGGDVALGNILGAVRFGDKIHVFADIVVQNGGTGVFHYIGLFEMVGDKVTHLSSYFVGDRIIMTGMVFYVEKSEDYKIELSYLDRKIDEPMAMEPININKILIEIKDGLFVQNSL
ncbi:MAG: hypothetical protein ACYCZW_02905 [Minisyncoccota bacterium]